MGHASFINGLIEIRSYELMEQTRHVINSFEFDEKWPFTNIFWCDSPSQFSPVVGLAGSYKQIEEVWSEWLWKFGQLLSRLDAYAAWVSLSCIMGDYSWRLKPEACCVPNREWPPTMINQPWVITSAPEQDFSIDTDWLRGVEKNLFVLDKETGALVRYHWDKFLARSP